MGNFTKVRIGFGVGFFILVLFYFFYVEGNKVPTIQTKEVAMDQIHKVEFVSSGSNANLLLFRDGENWFVGPRSYRADKREISRTVGHFARKFSLELVSRDPGYYLSAGLDSNAVRVIRIFGKPASVGGEHVLLKEVQVGKLHPSSSECVYVKGIDGFVYKISSYGFATEISRNVGHFRAKKIFPTESIGEIQKWLDALESVDFFGVSFSKKDVTEEQRKKLEPFLVASSSTEISDQSPPVSFLWRSDEGITLHPQKSEKFLKGVFSHMIATDSYLDDGAFREGDLKKYLLFEFSCRSTDGQQWTLAIYQHPEKAHRDKGQYLLSSSELKSLILLSSEDGLIKSIPQDWKKDWQLSI